MSSNIKPYVNQKFKSYLSNCDLINKYNFKSVHNIPRVKKLSLELNLKEFLVASDISEKNQKHVFSQTNIYLLFYIILGFIPQINYNKNLNIKIKSSKTLEGSYSVKLTFSTQQEIDHILYSIFIDSLSKLELDGFKFFDTKKINNKTTTLKSFLFSTLIPGNSFYEIESYFKERLNLKNLKFKLNLLISNPVSNNNNNIIKNLPFFWISG